MIKLAEARSLVEAGADELDMMINLGRLKSGDLCYVRDEIKAVVETIAPIPLKVILEVSRLTDDEIRRGANLLSKEELRSSRLGPAGRARRRRSRTSGLSTPSSKTSVGSRRQEGFEIFRPSRP